MNEYNVSDYSIFTNAISTIQKLNSTIDSNKVIIQGAKERVSDASTFLGPAAEEAKAGCVQVDSKISTMQEHLSQLSQYLQQASATYQEGDKAAETTVTDSTTTTTNTETTTTANSDISQKRKAFIGDVNDTSKYYIDPKYPNMQKDLRCFDTQTGEELTDNNTIYMKVGETRVLTVALPYNAGVPKQIIRTTAADVSSSKDNYKITSSKSDINPDPNVVDYVNYQKQVNHWPKDVDLHTNYYDWIITADKAGKRQISQTCEYESSAGTPKSMIGINVVITE